MNKRAERFYDEAEDFWPKRYAIWGRLIAMQPDKIDFSITDAKVAGKFMPSVFPLCLPIQFASLLVSSVYLLTHSKPQ